MSSMLTILVVASFGAVALIATVVQMYVLERRQVYKSLRQVEEYEITGTDLRSKALSVPVTQRLLVPGMRRLGNALRRFTPGGLVERLREELLFGGSPEGWDAERLLASKLISAVAVGGMSAVVLPLMGMPSLRAFILSAVFAAAGYYVPEWILRSRSGQRQDSIRRALPDALDLLCITVEAGLGFDAAVARVAKEAGGPLGEEFHRVVKEMQLGKSRVEALRGLSDRSSLSELKGFVLAMIQADIFGISIGKVLQVQASEMRIKRRQMAEERAQKLPVKLVFPLIFCIFPSLFIVLLGPAAIRIYENILSD